MSKYSESFKMNEHWANYVCSTSDYKYNIAIGAYRSGKSVFNTLAFCMYLESNPGELNLVIASTTTAAQAIVEDGNGFGISAYFGSKYHGNKKYKNCPAGYLDTKFGRKIILYVGGSKANSYALFRGFSVASIYISELNLIHENTLNEAKGRILMSANPKLFADTNPCNAKHPLYKWIDELKEDGLVNLDRSSIFDNPAMTEERRNEIISEFKPGSSFYRSYILGEDLTAESQMYEIEAHNIFTEFNPDDYLEYITVLDTGESRSASVMILAALAYDNVKLQYRLDILKSYYYKNDIHKNAEIKMYADTSRDYAQFVKESIELMGKYPSYILCDASEEMWRNIRVTFRESGVNMSKLHYVIKDEIQERIKRGCYLLYKGKLRFNKNTCEEIIADFQYAEYDLDKLEKSGKFDRKKEYNELGHLDGIDATDYAFTWYKNKLYMN